MNTARNRPTQDTVVLFDVGHDETAFCELSVGVCGLRRVVHYSGASAQLLALLYHAQMRVRDNVMSCVQEILH